MSNTINVVTGVKTLRVTNASTTVPVQLGSGNTYGNAPFRKAYIYGLKASQTNNTGTVYLGGPADTANGTQFIPITTGATITLEAPIGQIWDWSMFWLDVANAGDGIIALYS